MGGGGESAEPGTEAAGGGDGIGVGSGNSTGACADGCVATRGSAVVAVGRAPTIQADEASGYVPSAAVKDLRPKQVIGERVARMGRQYVKDAQGTDRQSARVVAKRESAIYDRAALRGDISSNSAEGSNSGGNSSGGAGSYSGGGGGGNTTGGGNGGGSGYSGGSGGVDDSTSEGTPISGDGSDSSSNSGGDGTDSGGDSGSSDNWWAASPEQCALWESDGMCDAGLGCVDAVDCACPPDCLACRARGLTYEPATAETCAAGTAGSAACYVRTVLPCALDAATSKNGTCYDPFSPYFYSGCPPPPDFLRRFCGPADADFYYPAESPCRVVSSDLKTSWLGSVSPVRQACKVQNFGAAYKALNWNVPAEADVKCQQLGEAARALGYQVRSWAYLRYDTAISTVRNLETGQVETVVHPGNRSYCEMERVCNHNASLSPTQCVADKVHLALLGIYIPRSLFLSAGSCSFPPVPRSLFLSAASCSFPPVPSNQISIRSTPES